MATLRVARTGEAPVPTQTLGVTLQRGWYMKLPLSRVAEFMGGKGEFDPDAMATGYSIDSRTTQPGELFFAVKGGGFGGCEFVEAALRAGAAAAVVNEVALARFPDKTGLIAVEDTASALHKLGAATRRLWGKTLVAVTGSTGKTATKDAIAHVLGTSMRVYKAESFGGECDLPLQLLALEPAHDVAVVELGTCRMGEIAEMAEMARPDVGVVTNVDPVRLAEFKSIVAAARADYELICALHFGAVAVLNADDKYASQFGRDFKGRVVLYGMEHPADFRAEDVVMHGDESSEFDVVGDGFRQHAVMPAAGPSNILSALAAVAVAVAHGVPPSTAVGALESMPGESRLV